MFRPFLQEAPIPGSKLVSRILCVGFLGYTDSTKKTPAVPPLCPLLRLFNCLNYCAIGISVERLLDPAPGIYHSQQHTIAPVPFTAIQLRYFASIPSASFPFHPFSNCNHACMVISLLWYSDSHSHPALRALQYSIPLAFLLIMRCIKDICSFWSFGYVFVWFSNTRVQGPNLKP